MTSPDTECTSVELEKSRVWPNGDTLLLRRNLCGGLGYRGARFAIRPGADIIPKPENYCSFLDIYDLVRAALGAGMAAKLPACGYDP